MASGFELAYLLESLLAFALVRRAVFALAMGPACVLATAWLPVWLQVTALALRLAFELVCQLASAYEVQLLVSQLGSVWASLCRLGRRGVRALR